MDRIYEAYHGTWGGQRVQAESRERMEWLLTQTTGHNILDIGCSQGVFPILLAEQSKDIKVLGVDLHEEAIAFAKNAVPEDLRDRVTFLHQDFMQFEASPEYDTVLIGQVLEHVDDPASFLDHASRCLAPGGKVIVTVPYGVWEHDEHQNTFYVNTFVEYLPSSLHTQSTALSGNRLCVQLTPDQSNALSTEELIKLDMQYMPEKELRYLKVDEARRERIETLDSRATRYKDRIEVMKGREQVLLNREAKLKEKVEQLQTEIEERETKLNATIAQLQEDLEKARKFWKFWK